MGFRQLRDPRRDQDVDEPNPETRDDASADEHVAVDRAGLDGRASQREHGTEEGALLAAILVSEPAADEAAKDGAKVVGSSEAALPGGVGDSATLANLSHGDEARGA